MATRQYIGARYVPKFYQNSVDGSASWESNVVYEPLMFVTLPNSHMYISKKEVPATVGTPASNMDYWLDMGSYNGFIAQLEQEIEDLDDKYKNLIYINVLNPPAPLVALDNTNATDNTSKLQAIIDYIGASPYLGACIYFPRGTYKIEGTVNVNQPHIRFLGEENGATRFETTTTSSGGKDMFYITKNFIKFEEIAFWVMGDNTYENTFIHCYNARRCIMEHCMLYDAKYSIVFDDSPSAKLEYVWIGHNVISYSNPIGIHFHGLCNSSYVNNTAVSLGVSSGTCLLLDGRPQDININQFESSRGSNAIEITCDSGYIVHDLQIDNCVLDEPNQYGIYIHDLSDASEVSVRGGFISPLSEGSRAIRLSNCKNILIEGVKMLNNHNRSNMDGISIGNVVENVKVIGCYFYDMIRAVLCIPNSPNAFKNICVNDNMVVNQNHEGGLIGIYDSKGGSVNNNSFRGNITQAILIGGTSANVICVGNNGLTNSTCTNNYVRAYAPTGFEPTLTNCFAVDE